MTAENFQACLAFTLKYEGGKSNDPRDPGGRTMEGVTQATYDASHKKRHSDAGTSSRWVPPSAMKSIATNIGMP